MRYKINRNDVLVVISLCMLAFLVKCQFLDYPIIQDSAKYAELGENMHSSFSYELDGVAHTQYPPGTPFLTSLMLFFTDDSGFAVRLVSVFFSSLMLGLLYIFLRYNKISILLSLLLSATVFFNPWFFYFTTILGLSEGAGAFFFMLGMFFMFLYFKNVRKTNNVFLGALFLGISVMMRSAFLFVIAIFSAYFCYLFLKRKNIKDSVIFIFVSAFPFACWFLRNLIAGSSGNNYLEYWSRSIFVYPYGFLYFVVLVFPVAFLGMAWYLIGSFRKVMKSRNVYWKLVIVSFVTTMLISILSWDLVNHLGIIQNPWSLSSISIDWARLFLNPLFASRYFVPFIPLFTVLIGIVFFRNISFKSRRFKILVTYALLLLCFTAFYTSGFLQNHVGEIVPVPSTFVQKADAGLQLIDFMEHEGLESIELSSEIDDVVLDESMQDLFDRFCPRCSLSDKNPTHVLIEGSCNEDGKVICPEKVCIFESMGRNKISLFNCR